MRSERSYRAVYQIQKKQVQKFPPELPELAYLNLLMGYASSFALNKTEIATLYHNNYQWSNGVSGGVYNVQSSEGLLEVTTLK